jgi:hypothetical protein
MFSKFIRAKTPSATTEPASMPAPVLEAVWEGKLQAAIGNDMELLALAKDAPSIDIKLSAVLALAGEDALRQAEREFRTHDRRVHRAVKGRYKTQVEQRETRVRADELIRTAAALIGELEIPANRLVELDQAWRALDAGLLEDAQKTRFSDLQQSLAKLLRERGEAKRSVSRWVADARQVLAQLDASGAGLANTALEPHELIAMLVAASEKARVTLAAIPASSDVTTADSTIMATLDQALQTALQDAARIEARLMVLDELQRGTPQPKPALEDGEPAAPVAIVESPIQRWQALAPVVDQGVENALNARLEAWQRIQHDAQRKRQTDKRQRADASDKAAHQARTQALTKVVSGAEAALAAGHLADALKHMPALQAASDSGDAVPALQARIDRLQAEIVRLKGWQHWGSEQARDDLVAEAEALARSTIVVDESSPAKLPTKQIEKSIEQLRARWKELDRLGGANSKALWQRFDSALKTAYVPVAAHLTRLNEARLENLAVRVSLLDALDAQSIANDDSGAAPDWKEIARALAHFQSEWRKLGPLQHTVPHKKLAALTERMKSSVARLEIPLREVLNGAKMEREQFIVRARALSQNAQDRDVIAKVRDLQTQWQRHAKAQPLPRAVENAMWTDFRAAISAAMDQREEALNARNTQLEANKVAREALIARLQAVGQDDPAAEIKRILAEVDSEWRKAGEAPRNQAAKLESKYRDARDKVQQYLANSAQRKWNVTCDALVGKLALCDEIEALTLAAPSDVSAIEARWAVLPALPLRWEQVLQGRFKASVEKAGGDNAPRHATAATGDALNDLLLQLESALDIPSPAAFQAARRTLKLLWMKDAMEGRRSASPVSMDINKMTAEVFGCMHYDIEQRHRLEAIIAVLRKSEPGGLGR